jgi:hypothetical protein
MLAGDMYPETASMEFGANHSTIFDAFLAHQGANHFFVGHD